MARGRKKPERGSRRSRVRSESHPSSRNIAGLVASFETCTLPRAEWMHRAHLTVALWYLLRHPADEATRRVREGIQRYNLAKGIPVAENGGYHETLTLFWVRVIRNYLARSDASEPIESLAQGLLEAAGDKDLPLEHYSRARLFSAEARAGWVEPDLKAL